MFYEKNQIYFVYQSIQYTLKSKENGVKSKYNIQLKGL